MPPPSPAAHCDSIGKSRGGGQDLDDWPRGGLENRGVRFDSSPSSLSDAGNTRSAWTQHIVPPIFPTEICCLRVWKPLAKRDYNEVIHSSSYRTLYSILKDIDIQRRLSTSAPQVTPFRHWHFSKKSSVSYYLFVLVQCLDLKQKIFSLISI
jgi:hypothetical protein